MEPTRSDLARAVYLARERKGLSQAEAAGQLGIDRPRLSGIERGERPLDAPMLIRMAVLYGLDMKTLIAAMSGLEQIQPFEVRLRGALMDEIEEDREKQFLNNFIEFIRRYAELRSQAELSPKQLSLPQLSATSATRKFAVEGDVSRLRSLWGLGDGPIGLRIFGILEDQGISVYKEWVESEKISGAFVDVTGIGPVIFVNLRDIPYRQVFTVAHELAHVLYHRGVRVSIKRESSADELLANDFASAFLMPESGIKRHLVSLGVREDSLKVDDVIYLQRVYGVSYGAMLVRLKKLNIIRQAQYEEFASVKPIQKALGLGYLQYSWELNYQRPNTLEDKLACFPREFVQLVIQEADKDSHIYQYLNLTSEEWSALRAPYFYNDDVELSNLEEYSQIVG